MSGINVDLEDIECVFLDLDGTIYLGTDLIPGAIEFLGRCEARGIQRFFLSNNSSRSVQEYVTKLQQMGIAASDDEVLLSTHDLVAWLHGSNYERICLVGTEGMRNMLVAEGLIIDDEEPELVVLGYDTEINYGKITTATKHLHRGVPLVASHPDIVCPSPESTKTLSFIFSKICVPFLLLQTMPDHVLSIISFGKLGNLLVIPF